MANFSEFFKSTKSESVIEKLRNKFHESRSEYELELRKHLLEEVKNCPCCFKGFFTEAKDSVKQRAFYRDFEPDDLDVLEQMFVTPVVFDESHNLINE
jgi:5-methylthioribose kinase